MALEAKAVQPAVARTERVREGSPWNGIWVVMAKELADNLTSARMQILELLIVLTAAGTVNAAIQNIRATVAEDRFLILQLFTTGKEPLPAFVGMLGLLIPLIAISLSFDSINGEFNRRTMSRVLAQPIYRDALLMAKFLAGLMTLIMVLGAIWLIIVGLGIVGLGQLPTTEEVWRLTLFWLASVAYGGAWLGISMLFSVLFRQPATAAMGAIAMWLFFTVFWGIMAGVIAPYIRPIQFGLADEFYAQRQVEVALSRVSPNTLYTEAMLAVMNPQVRAVGVVLPVQLEGAMSGEPLPLRESLLMVWPQYTGLIAGTILIFALTYVLFQRQEIRA